MIYTMDELKEIISPIAKKYNIKEVYIFGSYARNEATEDSDVDVLVDDSGSSIETLFDRAELFADLQDAIGKSTDLVDVAAMMENIETISGAWFAMDVLKERVKIYEAK